MNKWRRLPVAGPALAGMRQCEELGIGIKRYYKYRGMLEEAGLLRVEKGGRVGRRWERNTYYLAADVSPEALFLHEAAGSPLEVGRADVENSEHQVSEGFDFETL